MTQAPGVLLSPNAAQPRQRQTVLWQCLSNVARVVGAEGPRGFVGAHVDAPGIVFSDFKTITRAEILDPPDTTAESLYRMEAELLKETLAGKRAVRLIGLHASGLEKAVTQDQAALFGMTLREGRGTGN